MASRERPDIPQATLERTREIVDAVVRGAVSRAGVAASTGVAPRQVAYGVVSARILGLLIGDEVLSATELGRALARTEMGSADECEVFRRAIEASAMIDAVAPGLLSEEPPSRELVAANIRDSVGLSENTAAHRAGMLFGWRKRLLDVPDPVEVKERHLASRWHRIHVTGFRSLDSLSLDIGPLTVIHGPTASGKTTVADSLLLAHEVAVDAVHALERRGGIEAILRGDCTRLTLEHRVAATRDALEHSHRCHRVSLERAPEGFAIVDESWTSVHQNEVLMDVRADASLAETSEGAGPSPRTVPLSRGAAHARELSRLVALRHARRLALDPARFVEDASGAAAKPEPERRMGFDGDGFGRALLQLKESRSYPGFLEAARNVVSGLVEFEVAQADDGRVAWSLVRALGPGREVRLSPLTLSRGSLVALGVLVAAVQTGSEEVLVVELDELALDGARLSVVIDALVLVSRRATVILTTCDEDLAHGIESATLVHCEARAGRTEVASPGVRLLF